MKKLTQVFMVLVMSSVFSNAFASSGGAELEKISVDPFNKESLQNGAKLYVNYCLGCHSAKYVRYERIAQDLDLPLALVKENLMFTGEKLGDQMLIAMPAEASKEWFGATPPDLSLEAALRGPDWLYGYLTGFYHDDSRPWGVNNKVFKDVGMPNVVAGLEEELGEEAFHKAMYDLTNFMDYMAEPVKAKRLIMGRWVIAFLFFMLIPVLWLNHEYWKDVH